MLTKPPKDYRDLLLPSVIIGLLVFSITGLWFAAAVAAFFAVLVADLVYIAIHYGPKILGLFKKPEPHVWEPLEERRSIRITKPRSGR